MSDTGDDLIGYSWVASDGKTYTVESLWDITAGYMTCRVGPKRPDVAHVGDPAVTTVIRPIHAIRQHKQRVSPGNSTENGHSL